ncbi:hypothetical protein [Kitasatospora sp. MBT63]|uniref:hypothetical protein n=1 Tax=Kitasatospora sp. MBT63 TaxID=1444768 RepID=UPI00068FFAC4|nr:hypothetical protein [Kitasatospora sp. MBT63]
MARAEGVRSGVRPAAEVAREYERVRAANGGARRRGALAAYRWALGLARSGPLTGTPAREVPTLEVLTAEVDASLVQLEASTRPSVGREYIEGAHDALAWVCGHTDTRP